MEATSEILYDYELFRELRLK
ncbi:Protein of unknown function [Pyronema omphalodes CBS 100304]|uniref:Uncharacterized protein n=1 Tax=Pyronema omphalodes (strain CBS 100304) TaxID=1076935 RepID=U4LTT8_PYROM|nr:Protein of unknown function [Pyronema omphalodes CBS 100304]